MKKFLKKLASKLNFHVLTDVNLEAYLNQRDELLHFYRRDCNYREKRNDIVSCIIFSRDRGPQLFALLESMRLHLLDTDLLRIYVLYSFSSQLHGEIYEEVLHNSPLPVDSERHNGNNRNCLIALLQRIESKRTFFLCDDDIFVRRFDVSHSLDVDPECEILSLRHHPGLTFCYPLKRQITPPPFEYSLLENGLIRFDWFSARSDEWGDPWSVNGQFYPTDELEILSKISTFSAPNSFENSLKRFTRYALSRRGVCYMHAKIINLPMNRVQKETNVRHGNVTSDSLADSWKKGLKIDIREFQGLNPNSSYYNCCPTFIYRHV